MSESKDTTRFIYMGDPQCSRISGKENDYSRWGRLLARALGMSVQEPSHNHNCEDKADGAFVSAEPDSGLLILGGDIVNRGDRGKTEEWEAFFEARGAAIKVAEAVQNGPRDISLQMATPVNGSAESIGRYADQFINPGNGPLGHKREFFSFDWGCCHFLFLDSSYMGNRHKDACKFIGNWIKADLATNRKPVVFAVMHHPMYTVGTSFEDDFRAAGMRENYQRLLYRYGVDFILCGHQHVYARTKTQGDGNWQAEANQYHITQIMGVSGTKYFDAWDKSNMEVVKEYVSSATLFETDGERICLRTIDQDGTALDEYEQQVRPPKKRKCATCANFDQCRGTGEFERLEAEEMAKKFGDPLKPTNGRGIRIADQTCDEWVHFSDDEISRLMSIDVCYSVMRRKALAYETKHGCSLKELLDQAGISGYEEPNSVFVLTDSKGHQRVLPCNEVMRAWRYEKEGTKQEKEVVPPLLFMEDGAYRLAYGQQTPDQYNGRSWARDIRQIEVVLP